MTHTPYTHFLSRYLCCVTHNATHSYILCCVTLRPLKNVAYGAAKFGPGGWQNIMCRTNRQIDE